MINQEIGWRGIELEPRFIIHRLLQKSLAVGQATANLMSTISQPDATFVASITIF